MTSQQIISGLFSLLFIVVGIAFSWELYRLRRLRKNSEAYRRLVRQRLRKQMHPFNPTPKRSSNDSHT